LNNKAIDILKTFSRDEIKSFDEFLCSPFYNKSQKLINFYRALIRFYPAFDSKLLDEKALSKIISPELEFNKQTSNRLFYDLHHCAEEFLMILNFKESFHESQVYLRDELFKRKLFKFDEDNIRLVKGKLDKYPQIGADFFINMFHLHTDIHNLKKKTTSDTNEIIIKSAAENVSERAKHICILFVSEMVRNYEYIMTVDKSYNIEKESEFIISVFNKIDFPDFLKTLIAVSEGTRYEHYLSAYYNMLVAFSNFDNEKYYYDYKKSLLVGRDQLSLDQLRFHIGRLIRYCMNKRESGEQYDKFNFELFRVYEFLLEIENFNTSIVHYFPEMLFKTILLHSLRLRKYKWAIEFIKKYTKKLPPERKINMYHFSMAQYYFYRKMYKDSLFNLNKIKFDLFLFKIDYKNMMLVIYFEMEQYESALSLIDSYNHFLAKDSTLSLTVRKRQKRFINLINNLIQFKTTAKKTSSYYFDRTVDSDLPFADWIRGKYISLNILPKKAV